MEKEGKILIIPSNRLDPDLLQAVFTIARVYKARLGKKVVVGLDPDAIPAYLSEIFPAKDIKFTQEIQSKSFVINLKNKNAKIKDVKWEEKSGEIKLFITTDNGTIGEDVKVKSSGDTYEKIIIVGVQKIEQIGKLYTDNKDLFSNTEIVNIDLADDNANFGSDNSFVDPDASSFSELAYAYLNEEGLNPAAKEATDLLAGIIWKTKSFQINIKKPATFETCAALYNLNGNVFEANKRALQTLNLSQLRYINEIIKSVEVTSDGIAYAKVYKAQLNTLNPREIIFPLPNMLGYLKDVRISFILTELAEDKTLCDIRSNQKSVKASQIAAVFDKIGTSEHSNFTINANINLAENLLLDEINKIFEGSFPKKIKPEIVGSSVKEAEKIDTLDKSTSEAENDEIVEEDDFDAELEDNDLVNEDEIEENNLIEEETNPVPVPPAQTSSVVTSPSLHVPFDPLPPANREI